MVAGEPEEHVLGDDVPLPDVRHSVELMDLDRCLELVASKQALDSGKSQGSRINRALRDREEPHTLRKGTVVRSVGRSNVDCGLPIKRVQRHPRPKRRLPCHCSGQPGSYLKRLTKRPFLLSGVVYQGCDVRFCNEIHRVGRLQHGRSLGCPQGLRVLP